MLFTLEKIDGPYGDQTCLYDVVFNKKNVTLSEFIQDVLHKTNEWGNISIKDIKLNSKYRLKYRNGTIENVDVFKNIENNDLDSVIYDANASGGWSMMDYMIILN
jgi:hypothetical protein